MISRSELEARDASDTAYIKSWWISMGLWLIPVLIFILTRNAMVTAIILWIALGYDIYMKDKFKLMPCPEPEV